MKKLAILLLIAATHPATASCLTRLIAAEAIGEPKQGQIAVAHAAINHALKSGKSLCKLPAHYATARDKKARARLAVIAANALNGKTKDPTLGATSWVSGKSKLKGARFMAAIGHHRFYYVEKLARG